MEKAEHVIATITTANGISKFNLTSNLEDDRMIAAMCIMAVDRAFRNLCGEYTSREEILKVFAEKYMTMPTEIPKGEA